MMIHCAAEDKFEVVLPMVDVELRSSRLAQLVNDVRN